VARPGAGGMGRVIGPKDKVGWGWVGAGVERVGGGVGELRVGLEFRLSGFFGWLDLGAHYRETPRFNQSQNPINQCNPKLPPL